MGERPYDFEGFYDEAFERDGTARPHYAALLSRLAEEGPGAIAQRVEREVERLGVTFGSGDDQQPWELDAVPRILTASEWDLLERGLSQRVRALTAFIADVYADREAVRAGVVPRRMIETCPYFEPWMLDVEVATWAYAPVAGMDVVRDGQGGFLVLEENLRMPSGIAYMAPARDAIDGALPGVAPPDRRGDGNAIGVLAQALRDAAPGGDPSIVVLSDGESSSAWFEHRRLADELGVPLVTPDRLEQRRARLYATVDDEEREVQVVYRRTDEDTLRDESGRPTWLAETLLDPLRAGRLAVVNAFGTSVADDKLAYAYVPDLIRFFLGEEPVLDGVRTYDLAVPDRLEEALERAGELVFKPRSGYGGEDVFVGPHAEQEEREDLERRVQAEPGDWIAQETVALSRHPTIVDGRLEPRHVDLRAFVISTAEDTTVVPGGITRFAPDTDSLVVNSSQGGGAKDTWVVG